MSRWTPDAEALDLLERHGGPFDLAAFRRCWTDSYAGDVDASWGGRLEGTTRAAIALVKVERVAESLPLNYGGIVATRPLHPREVRAFLSAARKAAGCRWIVVRSVPVGSPEAVCHFGSSIGAWTSVVRIGKGMEVEATFSHKARKAIGAARVAGAHPTITREPDAFLRLYGQEARKHIYRYPDGLIRNLAERRLAWFHEVELGGDQVASVMVLRAPSHWIAWLAAQSDAGRASNANYLAVAELIRTAAEAGAPAVNLGISTAMPGVALFKRRFGATAVPVTMDRLGSPLSTALDWGHRRARDGNRMGKRLIRRIRALSRS